MRLLHQFISEILTEDLEGFLKDTDGVMYMAGSSRIVDLDKTSKDKAKLVKRAWQQNADHAFMKSLKKVHWIWAGSSLTVRCRWFLNNPGKDEIATSAYLPGTPMFSTWGSLGVLVDGTTTLAANDMDSIVSGYSSDFSPEDMDKFKSSGVPKRAGVFNTPMRPSSTFVLDRESFKPDPYVENEFIVDNWVPKALVLGKNLRYEDPKQVERVIEMAQQHGLPIVDENGQKVVKPAAV